MPNRHQYLRDPWMKQLESKSIQLFRTKKIPHKWVRSYFNRQVADAKRYQMDVPGWDGWKEFLDHISVREIKDFLTSAWDEVVDHFKRELEAKESEWGRDFDSDPEFIAAQEQMFLRAMQQALPDREASDLWEEWMARNRYASESRDSLAQKWGGLVFEDRVAASTQVFDKVVDRRKLVRVQFRLIKEDKQTGELLRAVKQHFVAKFNLDGNEEQAFNRLFGIVERGEQMDLSALRNEVFKAANLLGMKLPSFAF